MSEWKRITLEEASLDGGHYGIGAAAVEYDPDLPTYLRITDIRDDGTIIKDGLKSVDADEACEYYLKPNDLVVARTGASTGRNYFYDGRDGELVYAGFLIRFSIDERKIWPAYVKYWFQSPEYKTWLQNHTDGSTRANINAKTLGECPIYYPPSIATQRKIAVVLGALDDKIENNRKICANLEAQVQAIFKSWFVDDAKHIRETVQMQKVFDVTIGRTPPRKESEWFSENKDDNHVWVSIADMGSCGAFIFDSSEYLTDEAIRSFNFKVVPQDTVLLSFKLTVGRVAIATTDLVTNEAIAHLRSSDTRLKEYLYCYLKQFNYDNLGSTSSIATAVNSTTIKEMPFVVPEDGALNDFHQLVKPLFNQIRVLLFESRALAATRDALLPKLMSGEIDVEKVEVA